MIHLNLLSSNQKEALRARILFAMMERLMIILVSFTLLTLTALFAIKIRLTTTLSDVQGRQVLGQEYVSTNNETRKLNDAGARIERVQKAFLPNSAILTDFIKRAPAGVSITTMNYEIRTKALRVNGLAATREDLLAYEAALRGSPYVAKLESPVSNLLRKKDASFLFNAVLKVEPAYAVLDEPLKEAPKP
jgi:Tfp pilus assembly protein PilN